MTDKETLILAAKAAGIENVGDYCPARGLLLFWDSQEAKSTWNPRTSNADCFRLETVLQMNVIWYEDAVCSDEKVTESFADHNGDKDKARRYASTRAAALRGRE